MLMQGGQQNFKIKFQHFPGLFEAKALNFPRQMLQFSRTFIVKRELVKVNENAEGLSMKITILRTNLMNWADIPIIKIEYLIYILF